MPQKETQKDTIDLPEDEPKTVELLLHFLYKGDYDPVLLADLPQPTRPATSPQGHTYTYRFPHKCDGYYDRDSYVCPHHTCEGSARYYTGNQFTCKECTAAPLPRLNGDAEQLLTHSKMYEISDKYNVEGLKDLAKEKFNRACKHFWNSPSFAVAANDALSTTIEDDMGLRDIVIASICDHIELVSDPAISVLLTQFNGIALGILQAKVKQQGWAKEK